MLGSSKPCAVCGCPIFDRPSHLQSWITCSLECKVVYCSAAIKCDGNPRKLQRPACQECGKPVKRLKTKFCSHSCSAVAAHRKFRENAEMRECKECGGRFQPQSAGQKYCRPKCKTKAVERTRLEKHKESRLAGQRQHYAKHREAIRAKKRGDPIVLAKARESYQKHREKRLAAVFIYQKKNKDRVNAYHREYEEKVKRRKTELELAVLSGILQEKMESSPSDPWSEWIDIGGDG